MTIRPWPNKRQRHSIAVASEAEECSSALTTSRNSDDIEDTKCPKQAVSVSWSNAKILALLDIWTACLDVDVCPDMPAHT